MINTSTTLPPHEFSANKWLIWKCLFLHLIVLVSTPTSASEQSAQDSPGQLNTLSQQLVDKVKNGTAEASEFRTNVVFYRESLRSLMISNEKATNNRIDNKLLMQMVRMSALLQSAAECQTGRYISCPINLMNELEQQQKQLNLAIPQTSGSP